MALLASGSQYAPHMHQGSHFQSTSSLSTTSMLSQPSPTNSEFSEAQVISEDVRSWDERRVAEWLRSIGCHRYDNIFIDNNITGEVLLDCDHGVLKELGITKVGDRVRIFVAIKTLRNKASGNHKKRNRDTLAALDNIGPIPTYRTVPPSANYVPSSQNKRYSGHFNSSSMYSHGDVKNENIPPQVMQQRQNTPRISPGLDSARSNMSVPSTASRTPRTPPSWKTPVPGVSSPGRSWHHSTSSFEQNILHNCIKVISEGGATKVIDISGCNTPEAVMRRILKKFSITDHWVKWAVYTINKERENGVRCLGDADLLQIVHDNYRPERARLILKRRGSPPSPTSEEFQAAMNIARDQTDYNVTQSVSAIESNSTKPKVIALTGQVPGGIRSPSGMVAPTDPGLASPTSPRKRDSVASGSSRMPPQKIQRFFGQRPPSELISSNLAEYFPDHEHKALERTVRNSMRRSARMSKYNNRLSVATTRSFASSMSGDSIPPLPTVAGHWLSGAQQALQASPVSSEPKRPQSIRGSVLRPTAFKDDYLGAVPEDDVSPIRSDNRKSYMSFDSGRESLNVVITDTESTASGGYMDSSSIVSTPGTDPEVPSHFVNFLHPADDDDDEDDDELDVDMGELRWMKGTLIGSGSFGSVYLALNAITGELMAVKQVEMPSNSKDDARKQSMVDALTREIALLKDFQHPNIVQYLHSNKEDNCFNIFLEYVPGGSVAAMLNNYGPLSEPLIRNFVRQILAGLAYLHGKNIIHRDIKGANVLVDNKGCVKISDFGISKKVEAGLLTSASAQHRPSLQGSVFWMAPEVVKQTSYTLKADIWSLGCLIVEMFTGSHPYPEFTQLQAIFKIGTGGSAPEIPPKSTAEAKKFLNQTFELDHNKRPSADELLLSAFLIPLVGQSSSSE